MHEIIFFLVIGAVILFPQYLRHRERTRVHELIRLALERGQPIPSELITALRVPVKPVPQHFDAVPDRAQRDLRRGVVWLALGLGCVGVGAAFYGGLYNVGGSEETFGAFAAIGAVPACVGLAFLGLWFFNRADRV